MANKGRRMVFEEDIKKIGQGGTEYTAGDNITIEDGVISATDTTYTAGNGIDISEEDAISLSSAVTGQLSWLNEKTGAWYDNHETVDLTAFTTREVEGHTVYDITNVLKTFALIKTNTCSDTFAQSFANDYNGQVIVIGGNSQASSVDAEAVIYGAYFLVDDRDASDFKITLVATTSETIELARPLSTKYAKKRIVKVGNNDFKFLRTRATKINLGLGYNDGTSAFKVQYLEAFGKTINENSIRTVNLTGTGTQDLANVSSEFTKAPIAQVIVQAQYPVTTNSTNSPNYQIATVPSTEGIYTLKATVDANGILTKIEWVQVNNE